MNAILSFFDCRLSGRDTQRCWEHSNPTCYNRKNLNFLHSQVVGMQKHLTHSLTPKPPGEILLFF